MTSSEKDNLFTQTAVPEKFEFNESVARVFDDMLERSIPLYRECQEMVIRWGARFARRGTNLYDLGCSTGTLLHNMALTLPSDSGVRLIGVDNSAPMLAKAREKLKDCPLPCNLIQADLEGAFSLDRAGVVIMNYTLQFIPPHRRLAMMEKIFTGLNSGGCMILTEKVESRDPELDRACTEFHHEFKRARGYSNLEIAKKREALENILTPWTVEENLELLQRTGYKSVELFFKWNNFAGFVALK